MLIIKLKKNGINARARRSEECFNIILKSINKVRNIGSFNPKISLISLNINDLIIALKSGANFSNKFGNRISKITSQLGTRKHINIKY